MTTPLTPCPSCGTATSGPFCSGCGTAVGPRACRRCGASLTPAARFCHRCGEPSGGAASHRDHTPWLVAAGLIVLVIGSIIWKVAGGGGAAAPAPDMANSGAAGPTGRPPDISQMTPRERFDRLFNRVMGAAEHNDTATVVNFTPMALGAYDQLAEVDADARYHAAVLHLQVGQVAPALALADTILQQTPGHLFGYLVRGTAAQIQNNPAALRRAQADFLQHYAAEMKANRVEYLEHKPALDGFRALAGGKMGKE